MISCEAREMFADTCGQLLLKTDNTHNLEALVGRCNGQYTVHRSWDYITLAVSPVTCNFCQPLINSHSLRQFRTVSLDQQRLAETMRVQWRLIETVCDERRPAETERDLQVSVGLTESLPVSIGLTQLYRSPLVSHRCCRSPFYLAVCASLSISVCGCLSQSGAVPASRVPTSLTETPPASIGLCTLY